MLSLKTIFYFAKIFIVIVICFSSFAYDVRADARSEQLNAELNEMATAGAKGFLYWQYSGTGEQAFAFGSDQYSFLKGDPICEVLKNNANKFDFIGVNIPSLGTADGRVAGSSDDALEYLSNECGVNMIRIFGYPDRGGTDTTLAMVQKAASYGIQTIVVLCDYSNSCADLGIINSRSDPTAWYSGGFRISVTGPNYSGSYLGYARDMATKLGGNPNVYAIELLNEPHCSGFENCVPHYTGWASEVSSAIRSAGIQRVGIGQKASENTTRGDSPGAGSPQSDFTRSNSSSSINVTSGHYYNDGEKATILQALEQSKSLNKLFYVGEYGYAGYTQYLGGRPLDREFTVGKYPCNQVTDDEFHPLRPYPASPCELKIPQSKPEAPFLLEEKPAGSGNFVRVHKYINYACGTSIDFQGVETFNPYGYGSGPMQSPQGTINSALGQSYVQTVCEPEIYSCSPGETCPTLTCYRTLRYEIETNFRDSNLGIMGNTQTQYADKELVNNYLSWYFTGVPQIGDHEPIEPYSPVDEKRLLNFTGPVRKLLPFDAQIAIRSTIAMSHGNDNDYATFVDTHDYIVGCQRNIDWDYVINVAREYFQTIFGNLSDTIAFLRLLWDTARAVDDGFRLLGSLLIEIASTPRLLQPEHRGELVDLIVERGFSILASNDQFFQNLYEMGKLGGDGIRRLGWLIGAVKLDAAESCKTSDQLQRLSYFANQPYPVGHLPPDPQSPLYDDFNEFWDDFNEWRGVPKLFSTFNIPFPHYLLNMWAQLFPNIPLSGLEDIAGEAFFTGYGQGVGPYLNSGGQMTAPPQMNILEAVEAQ